MDGCLHGYKQNTEKNSQVTVIVLEINSHKCVRDTKSNVWMDAFRSSNNKLYNKHKKSQMTIMVILWYWKSIVTKCVWFLAVNNVAIRVNHST